MKSPILQVVRQLLYAPDPQPEQMFTRIRLMERDIILTIKVIALGLLGYILFFAYAGEHPASDQTSELVGSLREETIRGAFLGYLLFNVIIAGIFIAMGSLPFNLVRWLVYVAVVTDGIFAAILVNLTGDVESLLYWVFLFLIIRNTVSISQHRHQIALNGLIILCYILAPTFGRTLDNLGEQLLQPAHIEFGVAVEHTPTNEIVRESLEHEISNHLSAIVNSLTSSNISASQTSGGTMVIEPEDMSVRDAALTALLQIAEPREWQSKFVRIVLLGLLTMCCYGITVLWNYQVLTREEEQEFAARQNQLRSTGRLAAEIAHQLKNPLAIINNAAFSLSRALKESPVNIHDKISMIKEEVERSDRILTELMGYATLAEGKVERLNLREQLERAIAQVFPPAFDQNVKVTVDCPQEFPPMLMQQTHLNEILVNVLINAREAMQGDGWVEIEAVRNSLNRVIVTIRDGGPGLAEDRLEDIFEPYYSTKERGTGLGLAIVKHNVEIYGGSVIAESGLGKGTTFTLEFPFKVIVPVTT